MPCFTRRQLQRLCAGLCIACVASVAGCKSWSTDDLPGVTPYRMEIQQGNFVSQDMLAKLKRGMTREQVRFVLGTPLLTDMFHADRWDYVFFRERPNKTREERRISVFFQNNRLVRVDGNVKPEAQPGAKAVESQREAANAQGDEAPNSEAVKPEAREPQAPADQDRQ